MTGSETIVDAPVVIFEVLSPSTTHTDRFVKAREYQRMPSVQRYVMLEQDSVNAVVYARSGETWTHEILIADSILALPEIGVELPLAELYEGIVFEAKQDSDETSEGEPALGSRRRRQTSRARVRPVERFDVQRAFFVSSDCCGYEGPQCTPPRRYPAGEF